MSSPARHLVLVGMMGSGKSTAGRQLADSLDRRFVDVDDEVVAGAGRTIDEIFASEGEEGFRRRERDALLAAVADPSPAVIATGGGAVLDPENRSAMRAGAVTVWLRAGPEALAGRVRTARGRPMLGEDPYSDLRRLSLEREHAYEDAADAVVDVDHLDRRGVVEAVLRAIGAGERTE